MNALKDVLQHVSIHLENLIVVFIVFSFYCLFSLTKDLYLKEIAPAKNHYDYETCYVIHCSFPKIGYVFMAFLIRIFLLIVIS